MLARLSFRFVPAILISMLAACGGEGTGEGSAPRTPPDDAAASRQAGQQLVTADQVAAVRERAPARDAEVEPFRLELLDLAFKAASKFPKDPLHKDRARAQRRVVETCFELDLPLLALGYTRRIDNWRQGLGVADYVHYCVTHAMEVDADSLLEEAERGANLEAMTPNPQKWRIDRVKSRIAQCHLLLGQVEQAKDFGSGLESASVAAVSEQRALESDPGVFDAQLADLDRIYELQNLDEVTNALGLLAALYERYFGDAERREAIERRLTTDWDRIDVLIKGRAMKRMARTAIAKGEPERAVALMDAYAGMLDQVNYKPRLRLPEMAAVARVMAEAGGGEAARRGAERVVGEFDALENSIANYERTPCLRPVAEAWHLMGERDMAVAMYQRVLDVGAINPNIRPGINQLVDTLNSMAEVGFQPPAEMRARLRQRYEEVGA